MRTANTDAEAMLYFVQGNLAAAAHRFADNWKVEQPYDDDGIVQPWFLIHLPSGIVLRAQFSVEEVP